jgi:hypothetical protein
MIVVLNQSHMFQKQTHMQYFTKNANKLFYLLFIIMELKVQEVRGVVELF